jgi:hypothetical protein
MNWYRVTLGEHAHTAVVQAGDHLAAIHAAEMLLGVAAHRQAFVGVWRLEGDWSAEAGRRSA